MKRRETRWLSAVVLVALLTLGSAQAAIKYVDAGVVGGLNNGTSWANAYSTINAALSGLTGADEGWFKAGTYSNASSMTVYNRTLYGGFTGTETSRVQRDWVANPTRISGQGARNIFTKETDAAPNLFTLDGFTLQEGLGTGQGGGAIRVGGGNLAIRNCVFTNNAAPGAGGAVAVDFGSYATYVFSNCVFVANRTTGAATGGGAMALNGDSVALRLQDCRFESNMATNSDTSYGGAIRITAGGGSPTNGLEAVGCTFLWNASAGNGGAVYSSAGSRRIFNNCTFTTNAVRPASGEQRGGGAYYSTGAAVANVFSNCTFTGNSAAPTYEGRGGAVLIASGSKNTFTDCRFSDNRITANGGQGGAIVHFYTAAASNLLELTRCTFTSNYLAPSANGGEPGGSGIYATTRIVARDCDFFCNSAWRGRGAIWATTYSYDHVFANCAFVNNWVDTTWGNGASGGLTLEAGAAAAATTIENCTFYSNRVTTSGDGGGAINSSGASHAVTIKNCIFRNNPGRPVAGLWEIRHPSGSQTLSYTSVDTAKVQASFTDGGGLINVDPLFASDIVPFDMHLKSQGGRWNPATTSWVTDAATSTAIDVGDPASAYANEPTPNGARVNLGRYGNTVWASKSYVPAMSVLGTNGAVIANGEVQSLGKGSDYGTVDVGSPISRTFVVTNSGSATLNLTGTPVVSFSGTGAAAFSTNGAFVATSLAAGVGSAFSIQFAPSASLLYTALVSIANNDSTANPYTFVVAGNGLLAGAPDIAVLGTNGVAIASGEAASLAKGSAFGTVVTNLFVDRVFAVTNGGTSVLSLTGVTAVAISGDVGDFFTNGTAVATSIGTGTASTLQIRFQPQVSGLRTALVSIANDVPGKDPYTFWLSGTGDPGGEIGVLGTNGAEIASGAAASVVAGTDYGVLTIGGAAVDHVLTITNSGVNPLTFSAPVLSGAAQFSLVAPTPVSPVAPGGSTTIGIRCDPSAGGVRTALVSIANNDLNESPYTVALRVTVDVPAVANVVYVDENATGTPEDGSNWLKAYRTLSGGLAAGAGKDIWVAQGTYSNASSMTVYNRTLYGGFTGAETNRDQRNWVANPTRISGQGARNIFTKEGAADLLTLDGFTLQEGLGDAQGGGAIRVGGGTLAIRNCVFTNNAAPAAGGAVAVDIITYGKFVFSNCVFVANRITGGASGGGAMALHGDSVALRLEGCRFESNMATNSDTSYGGAIRITAGGGSPTNGLEAVGCTFRWNASAGNGGAVYSINGSRRIFNNCTFTTNAVTPVSGEDRGGGAYYSSGAAVANVFSNCTFTGNTAGTTYHGQGGAVLIADGSSNTFTDCRFSENRTTANGGQGGAIAHNRAVSGANLLELTRCTFTSNYLTQPLTNGDPGGAAVYARTRIVARDCDFVGNSAQRGRGAVWAATYSYNHVFTNCAFVDNSVGTEWEGGGGFTLGEGGAAAATAMIENCTFYSNTVTVSGGDGGAIHTAGAAHAVTIKNSIFRNNPGRPAGLWEITRGSGTLAISYTSVDQTKITAGYSNGGGLINVDPLFASGSAPFDVHLKSQGGRWNPATTNWVTDAATSPAIDVGDPASAYANEPTPNGARINLGRYGNTVWASKSYVPAVGVLGTNGAVIANGEVQSLGKGSDYGTVDVGSPISRTFVVTNSGAATLNLTGTPVVSFSGTGAAAFSTNGAFVATSLAAGVGSTFSIEFAPSASLLYTAVVSIANNDSTANPYTFVVAGQGLLANAPDIAVLGINGAVIASGEGASPAKGSDFGLVVTNLFVDRVFAVTNGGTSALSLTGTPAVQITGDTADFFTNGTAVATSIGGSTASTLQIRFRPQAAGLRTALVSIANDVSGKDPYTFWLSGTGDSGAEMGVLGVNGAELASGAAASVVAGTDYGLLNLGDGTVDHVLTITNSGVNPMTFSALGLSGAAQFSLVAPTPVSPVAPGGSTTLGVRLNPSAGGVLTAQVSIPNNDLDEATYTVNLKATVDVPPVAGVVYVDQNATGTPEDGSSWLRAYRSLTTALTSSAADAVLWVADATYDSGATLNVSGQTLYGGFAGTETALGQRDVAANPTILTGAAARRILSKTVAGAFTLDGFTLKDGKGTGAFFNQQGGAALQATAGSVALRNCVFTNNVTDGLADWCEGGAILASVPLVVENCEFLYNSSGSHGGAIYSSGSALTNVFSNCTFTGNASSATADARSGGAVFIKDGSRNTFTDCRFSDNRAPGPGGIYGGAIAHFRAAPGDNLLELTRCTFTGNRAVQSGPGGEPGGGAVYARTRVVAWNCDFVSNAVGYAHGGAVYIPTTYSYDHVFANCAFLGNTVANAANSGGGGALYLGAAAGAASAMIENCTFYSNRVAASTDHGGGAININGTLHAVTVKNSIFRNNPGFGGTREISRQSGTLTLSYTSIDQTRIVAGFTAGAGMINVDPLFASESAPFDLHLKSKGGRWNPVSSQWVTDGVHSPCIDTGDPASAYGNEPEDNGDRINMGRYGNTSEASKKMTRTLFMFQ